MHYRDTKTGKFVSATTWKRSRAHGGSRYKRVRLVTRSGSKARGAVRPATFPTDVVSPRDLAQVGSTGTIRVPIGANIPQEFLEIDLDDYFEAGYEADEEDEY